VGGFIGRIVRNARDSGLVDWDAIEDRTREVNINNLLDQSGRHHQGGGAPWSRGKHVFSCMNNRLMLKMTLNLDSHWG